MLPGDAECLAEPSGTGAEEPQVVEPAALVHPLEAVHRLQRAHEHGGRALLRLADEIEAPVDPVGAVDVGVARRAEHRRVSRRSPPKAVARGIRPVVGLDLDDRPADAIDEERDAQKRGRDLVHAAREERAFQRSYAVGCCGS